MPNTSIPLAGLAAYMLTYIASSHDNLAQYSLSSKRKDAVVALPYFRAERVAAAAYLESNHCIFDRRPRWQHLSRAIAPSNVSKMATERNSAAATILLLIFVGFAIQLLRVGRRPKNLPPGPPTLPFIGNLHQIPNKNVHEQYRKWAAKCIHVSRV